MLPVCSPILSLRVSAGMWRMWNCVCMYVTCVQSDPEFESLCGHVADVELRDAAQQAQCCPRYLSPVIRAVWYWQTRHNHIGITNSFDL